MKISPIALTATLLLSSVVFAQQPSQTPAPATDQRANTAMIKHSGEWRASKFIGLDIYNQQNEKIGDVNEILIDQNGRVTGYVVGVGGFLGMGEHDVLVKPDQIKLVNEPVRRTDAPRPAATDARNVPADRRTERTPDEKWYPDHGVINATKDQLKALPEFKYSSYN